VGAAVGIELADARPVAYKPMQRCVIRYADAAGRARLFGKVFHDDRGAPMPAWFAQLRARLEAWDLPVPAAYLPEPRLLLFEAVEGAVELAQLLRSAEPAAALDAVARAADGLRAFREVAVEGVPLVTPQEILRPLERGRRQLQAVVPDVAGAVGARLDELAQLAEELPAEPLGLAHGAFRAGQLLVRGERIVTLDLDSLCVAGAGMDPGSFLAGLDVSGVRSPELRPVLAQAEAVFAAHIDGLDARWVGWHRAAACVEHALRRAYALEPEWPSRLAALLSCADGALAMPAAA
jgi:hypothetical protein